MIVIINCLGDGFSEWIDSVYEVDEFKPLAKYSAFLKEEAIKRGIIINPHYKNIMDKSHHKNITDNEYKKEMESWNKFLKSHNYKWFIKIVLNGKPVVFSTGSIFK